MIEACAAEGPRRPWEGSATHEVSVSAIWFPWKKWFFMEERTREREREAAHDNTYWSWQVSYGANMRQQCPCLFWIRVAEEQMTGYLGESGDISEHLLLLD